MSNSPRNFRVWEVKYDFLTALKCPKTTAKTDFIFQILPFFSFFGLIKGKIVKEKVGSIKISGKKIRIRGSLYGYGLTRVKFIETRNPEDHVEDYFPTCNPVPMSEIIKIMPRRNIYNNQTEERFLLITEDIFYKETIKDINLETGGRPNSTLTNNEFPWMNFIPKGNNDSGNVLTVSKSLLW